MIKDARKESLGLTEALCCSRRFHGVGPKFLHSKVVASFRVGRGFGLVSVASLMVFENNFAIKTTAEAMDSFS